MQLYTITITELNTWEQTRNLFVTQVSYRVWQHADVMKFSNMLTKWWHSVQYEITNDFSYHTDSDLSKPDSTQYSAYFQKMEDYSRSSPKSQGLFPTILPIFRVSFRKFCPNQLPAECHFTFLSANEKESWKMIQDPQKNMDSLQKVCPARRRFFYEQLNIKICSYNITHTDRQTDRQRDRQTQWKQPPCEGNNSVK